MSLNDDSESNVLEGIQNSELLADLRETSWRKVEVVLDWLDCDIYLMFELLCACFEFCFWNMELDVVSVATNVCYDCVVMAHDENLGRNSDGIWV